MSDDMKAGDNGTRLGTHNQGKPSLGKALGHGIVRHAAARRVAAVAVPVVLAVIGVAIISGVTLRNSLNTNESSGDTQKYGSTEVVQPTCKASGSSSSCGEAIAELAAQIAVLDKEHSVQGAFDIPTDSRYTFWKQYGDAVKAKHTTDGSHWNGATASCTQFVEKVIMGTVDKDIWGMSPGDMLSYLSHHGSGKWKQIDYGDGDIEQYLQPGDIIAVAEHDNGDGRGKVNINSTIIDGNDMNSEGHDAIYIGNKIAQKYHPGTDSNVAQAAYMGHDGSRSWLPFTCKYTAKQEDPNVSSLKGRGFTVWRFVGTPDPLTDLGVSVPTCESAASDDSTGSGTWRDTVVKTAESFIGGTYVWAAEDPAHKTFDCSGLVKYCYSKVGVTLAHQSEAQHQAMKNPKPVSEAKPGDIVWRPGHVGICIGNGRTVEAMWYGIGIQYGKVSSFKYAGSPLSDSDSGGSSSSSSDTSSKSSSVSWKKGKATAYDGKSTATGDKLTSTSMGVAIPQSWKNYKSYYGKYVHIKYKDKTVTAKINDCGDLQKGKVSLDLQPAVVKALGGKSEKDWGKKDVQYYIDDSPDNPSNTTGSDDTQGSSTSSSSGSYTIACGNSDNDKATSDSSSSTADSSTTAT